MTILSFHPVIGLFSLSVFCKTQNNGEPNFQYLIEYVAFVNYEVIDRGLDKWHGQVDKIRTQMVCPGAELLLLYNVWVVSAMLKVVDLAV